MSGTAARALAEAPMVLAYHTVEARKLLAGSHGIGPLESLRRKEEERLARDAARVVFFSEYDLAETSKVLPALSGKGVVIPPGVGERFRRPPPREVARRFLGLPGDGAVFLLASRGGAGKDAETALASFRSFRERWRGEARLLVAGQEGASTDDVRFLGSVPHDGMPMLFAASDAAVCPSRYESFGLAPLESLASGVPVIVPGGTYWGEKVRSEGGGLVYGPEDPAGLAGAMLSLLSDPPLRARMSLSGPEIAAPFTWERCTASWETLLASVSRSRSPR
jgi:glycosyltransferase involved in cell wall biosynthesis